MEKVQIVVPYVPFLEHVNSYGNLLSCCMNRPKGKTSDGDLA